MADVHRGRQLGNLSYSHTRCPLVINKTNIYDPVQRPNFNNLPNYIKLESQVTYAKYTAILKGLRLSRQSLHNTMQVPPNRAHNLVEFSDSGKDRPVIIGLIEGMSAIFHYVHNGRLARPRIPTLNYVGMEIVSTRIWLDSLGVLPLGLAQQESLMVRLSRNEHSLGNTRPRNARLPSSCQGSPTFLVTSPFVVFWNWPDLHIYIANSTGHHQ
ncbi:hypothetical protein C8Q75DRAFT_733823 [Abortiporus biennis]|nr:hypothetical protein C8Q75DRAFT_733823 [Abortiporus biennis]